MPGWGFPLQNKNNNQLYLTNLMPLGPKLLVCGIDSTLSEPSE
jgi:hypothetical protein